MSNQLNGIKIQLTGLKKMWGGSKQLIVLKLHLNGIKKWLNTTKVIGKLITKTLWQIIWLHNLFQNWLLLKLEQHQNNVQVFIKCSFKIRISKTTLIDRGIL